MPKTKKSHRRSDDRKVVDSDELSNQSAESNEVDEIVEHKKRHRKKSSKKGKKHKSKRRPSPSDSDSDSSDSSESSSSDSSSEEEVVKRKKQKKHKKSKRRNRHEGGDDRKPADNDVEIMHEPPKVLYISSDEEKHHHSKQLKRGDERKRPNDGGLDYKSKWDSPSDDFERKRNRRDTSMDRRPDDKYRGEGARGGNFRERSDKMERHERSERSERGEKGGHSPRRQRSERQERGPAERRQPDSEYRRDRREEANPPEWRSRERVPDIPDRYRKDERELNRERFRPNEGRFSRQESERDQKRSFSPKERSANRSRFDERRDDKREAPRFNYNDNRRDGRDGARDGGRDSARDAGRNDRFAQDRRPEIKREFNDREGDRSRNERPREPERNRPERDARDRRSPRRSPDRDRAERPRSPLRANPFRRNKNPEDHSDFRHDGQRADRNDKNERSDGPNRNDRKGGIAKRQRFNNKESDNENYEWGKAGNEDKKDDVKQEQVEKEQPNFGLSGKLTEDANTVNGVVIKYTEPPEARRPKRKWRLYPFKNDQSLNTIYIHRQSCFLIGRDKKVCEIAVDHPSCSKQHAALQYRLVNYERNDGGDGKRVRPYIIDLESANGTYLNNNKIEPRKYYELFEKDMLKFGFSSREYILLHEDSGFMDGEVPAFENEIKSEN